MNPIGTGLLGLPTEDLPRLQRPADPPLSFFLSSFSYRGKPVAGGPPPRRSVQSARSPEWKMTCPTITTLQDQECLLHILIGVIPKSGGKDLSPSLHLLGRADVWTAE